VTVKDYGRLLGQREESFRNAACTFDFEQDAAASILGLRTSMSPILRWNQRSSIP